MNKTPVTSNENPAKHPRRPDPKLSPEEQKGVIREVERSLRWEDERGLRGKARKHPLDEHGLGAATPDSGTKGTLQSSPTVDSVEPGAETKLSLAQVDETLFPLQLRGVRLYDVQVERLRAKHDTKVPKKPVVQTQVRVDRGRKSILGWLSVELLFPNRDSPEYRLRLTLQSVFGPRDASTALPREDQLDRRLACTILTMLWPYARETAHDLMRRMEVEAFPLPTIDKLAVQKMAEWDWDRVFAYLVEQCDLHGGHYLLPTEEVAHFKDGDIGDGWGEANLRYIILPRYSARYPAYKLNLAKGRRYLECTRN